MATKAYTLATVEEAVGLANLFVDGREVTRAELRDLLHLYVLDEKDLDVELFGGLAARIRAVLALRDKDARVVAINELLETFQPSPRIVSHDGQAPHFHYVTSEGPAVAHVGASFAMALSYILVDHDADRLGACAAPACSRLFFDQSRSRRQRFCSKTCATRVHVAAHRARTERQDDRVAEESGA
jgi:hypothetical protein